ncbi:MAG: DNA polymerase III subunit [Planctomycetes bacterium]|jgi:DNA polymerase-3 subunit delta'|nr:DNA polymerase III subunit [Planctomycetota bacterium]
MSFDGIRSQEPAIRLLRQSLRSRRLASAYILSGPEGVGKGLVALAFARAILCPGSAERTEACGSCGACIRSAAGTHPGLLVLERAAGRTEILLAQVHELTASLSLRPAEGDRTAVIVRDAERLNEEGFNALLKSVEEPPPGATFVFTTLNREAVPETIRSRSQHIRFRPLPRESVREILLAAGVEEARANAASELAEGSMGRATRILGMGLAERLGDLEKVLASERDAVAAAAALGGLLTPGGGRHDREGLRERAEEILRTVLGLARRRFLVAPDGRGELDDAGFCFRAIARGLDNLRLNLPVDVVFVSVLGEVLPRWQKRPSM